jgi:hypothetical protein
MNAEHFRVWFHLLRKNWKRRLYLALHGDQMRGWRAERARCQSPDDYFRLAGATFGIAQKHDEIIPFLDWVRSTSPKVICEIGTQTCGNSFLLSQALPSAECFIGLDLFVQNWYLLRDLARRNQQLHALNGSSYDSDTLARVKRFLGGRQIDLLFIDGDHSYEGAKKDFLAYRDLVREGGIIAFHDIVPDHGTRLGIQSTGYAGEVPVLWKRLKDTYPSREFVCVGSA